MRDKKILFSIVLLLLIPISFSEIVIHTNDNNGQISSTHNFIINTYFPYSEYPLILDQPAMIIEPIISYLTIDPCQEAELSFKITNPGSRIQTYSFSVENFEGTAYIAKNIILESKESKTVDYKLKPACSDFGEINPQILVETDTEKAVIPVILNIDKNYEFSVDAENEISVCNDVETRIPFKIENLGNLENYFTIRSNRDWISFDYSEIKISQNSEAFLEIIVRPSFNTEATSVANIEILPQYGEPFPLN